MLWLKDLISHHYDRSVLRVVIVLSSDLISHHLMTTMTGSHQFDQTCEALVSHKVRNVVCSTESGMW